MKLKQLLPRNGTTSLSTYELAGTTAFRSLRMQFIKGRWNLSLWAAARAKRLLDIVVSSVMLITLLPVLSVVSLLIKVTDGGPVLYWQTRIGRWGRPFPCPKLRSMVVNADALRDRLRDQNHHGTSVTFKIRHDPRITWIGRIIRKTSVDELPQLWNVLCGTMSLVGPRPPIPGEVARYHLADRRRLDVTPGLTCIWQVSGRGDIAFPEQVQLDVEYIENRSLLLDAQLLVRTISAVLFARGAY